MHNQGIGLWSLQNAVTLAGQGVLSNLVDREIEKGAYPSDND